MPKNVKLETLRQNKLYILFCQVLKIYLITKRFAPIKKSTGAYLKYLIKIHKIEKPLMQ